MLSWFRAVFAISIAVLITVVLIPVQVFSNITKLPIQSRIPVFVHRFVCKVAGIRVRQTGNAHLNRPLLIVANHCSWIDICVVSASLPVSFVAHSEIAKWPFFGILAKLQRSVFVERYKRITTKKTADEIASRLSSGDAIVLFAEGTSSNGNVVLPFRSALLGAAYKSISTHSIKSSENSVWVQPLSIAYTSILGFPVGRQFRHIVSWYREVNLVKHIFKVVRTGAIDVKLIWGQPVPVTDDLDRKILTKQLEEEVRTNLVDTVFDRTANNTQTN